MSRRKKKKRKLPGHYCWACDRRRPNQKFSGRGHARHVCRECWKLGAEELAYRQALRDLDRCMTWEGCIARKRRKCFERFLRHDAPRIRGLAQEMWEKDQLERTLWRVYIELDDILAETGDETGMGLDDSDSAGSDENAWHTEWETPF